MSVQLLYIDLDGDVVGPISMGELLARADHGLISAQTRVKIVGQSGWETFGKLEVKLRRKHSETHEESFLDPKLKTPPDREPERVELSGSPSPECTSHEAAEPKANSTATNKKQTTTACGCLVVIFGVFLVLLFPYGCFSCSAPKLEPFSEMEITDHENAKAARRNGFEDGLKIGPPKSSTDLKREGKSDDYIRGFEAGRALRNAAAAAEFERQQLLKVDGSPGR